MSTAPRILVLFGNVPLLGQEFGNIEAIDALAESGCAVLFLIRNEWTRDTIQKELTRRGLPFVPVPYFDALRHGVSPWIWVRNIAGILGGSWQLLRRIRRFRATHLHVGSLANVINFAPALAVTRLPLVFRVGDIPHSHHLLWRLTWRFACWRTDRFVCISRFLRDQIVSSGAAPVRISVIYNRPPGRRGQAESARARRGAGMQFVYVGQLIAEKGVGELVDAAIAVCKESEGVRFLVIGRVDEKQAFVRDLIARVRSNGLEQRIVFPGYQDDVPRLLADSDVHVCPSLCQEGLGNVVLEAKAAGLPSIIFPSGGLPELVAHGVDGYVCQEASRAALLDALRYYLRDRVLARTQGMAARESLGKFDFPHFGAKWRDVYNRVSNGRSR